MVCKDVGGSFGIKLHVYADEIATYALSKPLRRPVKFVADRVESFITDIHARDHRCKGRIGVERDGTILAFDIDDLTASVPIRCIRAPASPRPIRSHSRRRTVHDAELSRASARRVPEQERDVPVSRRRTSGGVLGDGGAGRSGGDEHRYGPGRDPPPQSRARRCLSLRVAVRPQVRTVVASCGDEQADGDDGL